jgi:thiol-disulfide isomerase/thioredoxin
MKWIKAVLAVACMCLLGPQARAADGPGAAWSGQRVPAAPASRALRPDVRPEARADITGTWRTTVRLPGGEAPFLLEIRGVDADPVAVARSAGETVAFSRLEISGSQIVLAFADPRRVIRARLAADGQRMEGTLHDERAGSVAGLELVATRGPGPRFAPVDAGVALPGATALAAVPSAAGTWTVAFVDDESTYGGVAELADQGNGVITGMFLTPAGDHRHLEGTYEKGVLRLSGIDGARVILLHARARKDGGLDGDIWVDDGYHAVFTAERPGSAARGAARDPFARVQITNAERKLRVTMPDLAGRAVSLDDPRFRDKVVIVDIFGTWCFTCRLQAPLLVEWHRRYRARGLEIVGLSFELSGEPENDRRAVRQFQSRFGIEFPLLLSDAADTSEIGAALPDLSGLEEYPTTILIGRDGTVRYIHSGLAAPAVGAGHAGQRAELERLIEQLLDEPAQRAQPRAP